MLNIIEKKKFGQELTREEIGLFARAAAERSVPDYQLSALLMAIRLNGMTDRETTERIRQIESRALQKLSRPPLSVRESCSYP